MCVGKHVVILTLEVKLIVSLLTGLTVATLSVRKNTHNGRVMKNKPPENTFEENTNHYQLWGNSP